MVNAQRGDNIKDNEDDGDQTEKASGTSSGAGSSYTILLYNQGCK